MVQAIGTDILKEAAELVGSPELAASQALEYAVDYCQKRSGGGEEVAASLRRGEPSSHEYLRYGLALRLGEYLGDADSTVKALYLCNWDNPCVEEVEAGPACVTSPLSTILWVERRTAALEALLSEFGKALTKGYKDLVAPEAGKLNQLLDVQMVDDDEVEQRHGYGAVLNSIHARPEMVWQRSEE